MSSISRARLWEMWRLSRLELLMRIGYSSIGAAFMGTCVAGRFSLNGEVPPLFLASMALVVLCCSALFSSSWFRFDPNEPNFDFQLSFTLPVSTCHVVLGQLAFAVVTSALCFLVPAMLFEWISGMELNVVSPMVAICSFVVCATNARWSSSSRMSRILGSVGVCVVFVVATTAFCSSRMTDEPLLFALGRPEFLSLKSYQLLLLILAAAFSTWVGLRAVEAQRHGERLRFGWLLNDRAVDLRPSPPEIVGMKSAMLPSSGVPPWKARLWRHWRQTGKTVLLTAVVLTIVITAFVTAVQLVDPRWRGGGPFWLVTLILAPVVYQIIAAELMSGLKRKQGMTELSIYDAVQPVRDDTSIATILTLIAVLSCVGWMLMAMAAAAQTFCAGDFSFWKQLGNHLGWHLRQMAWYHVLHLVAALGSFFVISSAAMLTFGLLAGFAKERYVYISSVVGASLIGIGTLDLINNWEMGWFWIGVQVVFGVTAACTFGFGICVCMVRRPFGAIYGIFVAVVSLTAVTGVTRILVGVLEVVPVPLSTTQIVLATINLAAAIVAALSLPPLALNLHRHR